MPDFKKIKFIDYDYAKYGASAERRRLIAQVGEGSQLAAAVSGPDCQGAAATCREPRWPRSQP